jgi:hypothetical protein
VGGQDYRQNCAQAEAQLESIGFTFGFDIRSYQRQAIEAVEGAIRTGKRSALVAMAATVQGMARRILGNPDNVPPVDTYDCIVVDECHRGYLLDREMSDTELMFRDQGEYISVYRRVLDHFDAVKVGLTATPALHTTQIFGDPVFVYTYREAVLDGVLVDHEPPIVITTQLSREGIGYMPGEQVMVYAPETGQVDLFHTPDDLNFDVTEFNRKVITEPFNRVVVEALAERIQAVWPRQDADLLRHGQARTARLPPFAGRVHAPPSRRLPQRNGRAHHRQHRPAAENDPPLQKRCVPHDCRHRGPVNHGHRRAAPRESRVPSHGVPVRADEGPRHPPLRQDRQGSRATITGEHAAKVAKLPPIHEDPFDRILVAQASVEPMILLTNDDVLRDYGSLASCPTDN